MNSLFLICAVHRGCSAVYRVDRVSHAIVRYRVVLLYSATHACPRCTKTLAALFRASCAIRCSRCVVRSRVLYQFHVTARC